MGKTEWTGCKMHTPPLTLWNAPRTSPCPTGSLLQNNYCTLASESLSDSLILPYNHTPDNSHAYLHPSFFREKIFGALLAIEMKRLEQCFSTGGTYTIAGTGGTVQRSAQLQMVVEDSAWRTELQRMVLSCLKKPAHPLTLSHILPLVASHLASQPRSTWWWCHCQLLLVTLKIIRPWEMVHRGQRLKNTGLE